MGSIIYNTVILVIIPAVGKRRHFLKESFHPWRNRRMGQINVSRLDLLKAVFSRKVDGSFCPQQLLAPV